MCKWNSLLNMWHNVLGSLYLKLHKTLVNLQIQKLISNKMRICRYLTRHTRLGKKYILKYVRNLELAIYLRSIQHLGKVGKQVMTGDSG